MDENIVLIRLFINKLVEESPDDARWYVTSIDKEIAAGLDSQHDDLSRCYQKLSDDEIKAFAEAVLVNVFDKLGCTVMKKETCDKIFREMIKRGL